MCPTLNEVYGDPHSLETLRMVQLSLSGIALYIRLKIQKFWIKKNSNSSPQWTSLRQWNGGIEAWGPKASAQTDIIFIFIYI